LLSRVSDSKNQSGVVSLLAFVALLAMLGAIYAIKRPAAAPPVDPGAATPTPRVTASPGRFAPWFPITVTSPTETWFPAEAGGRLFVKDGDIKMALRLGVLERTASSGEADVVALIHRVSDRNGYIWDAECVLGNAAIWPMNPDVPGIYTANLPGEWKAALDGDAGLRGLTQVDRARGIVAPIALEDRIHRIPLDESIWEYDVALLGKDGSYPLLLVRIRGLQDAEGQSIPEFAFAQTFDQYFMRQRMIFDKRAGAHLRGFFPFPIVFARMGTGGDLQKDVYFEPQTAPAE